MRRLQKFQPRSWLPYLCFTLATAVVGVMCYHPYYFGDELFSHYLTDEGANSFSFVLSGLNAYKPRILYNILWAWIASSGMPRLVPLSLTVIFFSVAAGMSYRIALRRLSASALAAAIVAILLIFSRFGIALYFDAVSGTIESLSLALFLTCVNLHLREADPAFNVSAGRSVGLLLSVCLVLVHERYYAGVFVIGISQLIVDIRRNGRTIPPLSTYLSLLTIALPPITFVLASRYLTALSITTGTAGIPIKLGIDTLLTAATNSANAFLGLNYGFSWLVGSFNMGVQPDRVFMLTAAPLFFLAWMVPLLSRNILREDLIRGFLLVLLAFAMIAVASLPGSSRQEGRWLLPVGVLISLLAAGVYRGWARAAILALLLVSNATQLVMSSYSSIYNVSSSRAAADLGVALELVAPPGTRHLLIGTPNLGWALGGVQLAGNSGYQGDTFCRANALIRTCFDLATENAFSHLTEYTDAWVYRAGAGSRESAYRIIPTGLASLLSSEGTPSIEAAATDAIGGNQLWQRWSWNTEPILRPQGLELSPGTSGSRRIDVRALAGRILVYHAKSLQQHAAPMRLQINWINSKGDFLGTSIKVVQAGPRWTYYGVIVEAPEGASFGDVYATLHDNAQGKVLLDTVSLVKAS